MWYKLIVDIEVIFGAGLMMIGLLISPYVFKMIIYEGRELYKKFVRRNRDKKNKPKYIEDNRILKEENKQLKKLVKSLQLQIKNNV